MKIQYTFTEGYLFIYLFIHSFLASSVQTQGNWRGHQGKQIASYEVGIPYLSYEYFAIHLFQVRSQNCERGLLVRRVCLSAWNNSGPNGRIIMKSDIWVFFEKSVEKIKVSLKSDKNNGYFTWIRTYIYDNILLNSC